MGQRDVYAFGANLSALVPGEAFVKLQPGPFAADSLITLGFEGASAGDKLTPKDRLAHMTLHDSYAAWMSGQPPRMRVSCEGQARISPIELIGPDALRIDCSHISQVDPTGSGALVLTPYAEAAWTAPASALPPPPPVAAVVEGSLILTVDGPRPVEDLHEGSLIATRDSGLRPLRALLDHGQCASPVIVAAGRMGNRQPLLLSPSTRLLLDIPTQDQMNVRREALCPVSAMLDGAQIRTLGVSGLRYYSLMFDRHEIIVVNGAAVESLHPDPSNLADLSPEMRMDIFEVITESDPFRRSYGLPARQILSARDVRHMTPQPAFGLGVDPLDQPRTRSSTGRRRARVASVS